ncbi:hypothetical protein JOS77_30815 [Chromobacterium haemolyticum]|nr:hypothetical protein JOS77_30815 [Chromobacterium haemolyticum]
MTEFALSKKTRQGSYQRDSSGLRCFRPGSFRLDAHFSAEQRASILTRSVLHVTVDWLVHGELDEERDEIIAELNMLSPMVDTEGLHIVRLMMRKLAYK